tara:strand:+ start:370 stop:675 length:306 start_codon:yes stop_codon:yes gene_type:complete
MNLTDEEITQIVRKYERRLKIDHERYLKMKDDPEFIKKNRARANEHYKMNREKKLQAYQDDKEFYKAKNLLSYWRKKNKDLTQIEVKHPEKYKILKERGLL